MAAGLPAELVEETALTLSSVSQVTLPPEHWPAVERTLAATNLAVDTNDADALRAALDELQRFGLTPRYREDFPITGASPVADAPLPAPPPIHGAPPPMAPARPAGAGRIWLGAGLAAVVVLVTIAVLGLLSSTEHSSAPHPQSTSSSHTGATSPTGPTSASPIETPTQPTSSGGTSVAVGLLAAAAVVLAVVVIVVRRRSQRHHPPPAHFVDAGGPVAWPVRPATTFAPNELVELANRTVDRLVDKGGTR
ncbi:hypothetical protein PT015_24455 [Candidatus Mycobacterium wuenschmannii]|uniref:Transmembrane protein n=1 Tax=Candidatus Mycobacterium wuenschmannii TaxID=3027808 RepID=A0ABY8VX91_9MYCO|nr:CATRA system-associated protein [Candidatus Mycobacterium wuenschmannii]WIM87931.1 hypothetical protein PT015_24455 [Candidatus Mycobacterium wuenschmannii]